MLEVVRYLNIHCPSRYCILTPAQTIPLIAITFYGVIIRVGMDQVVEYTAGNSSDGNGVLSTILNPETTTVYISKPR